MTTLAVYADAFRRVTESTQASLFLACAPYRAGQTVTLAEVSVRSFEPTGRTVRAEVVKVEPSNTSFYVTVRALPEPASVSTQVA